MRSVELSPRQREIAELVMQGKTSREIAEQLGIAVQTVKNHRQTILDRLGAPNSAALASFWRSEE